MTIGSFALVPWLLSAVSMQGDPIPIERAARAFGEIEAASAADGGKLWGHELLGPVLFAERASRAVVANQPDEESKLTEKDGVFVGVLPPEVGIANTSLQWAGVRWTMVVWPLPESRYERAWLLLHECFHRIQPLLPHAGSDPPNAHLDGEAGRAWLRLEMRALAEALVRRSELRERSLEDALLFRAQRRALFPTAATEEAALERNEGLANYTGLVLSGLPEWVLADRAAAKLERDELSDSFVRSFAYATGPGYGVLLDELAPGWRPKVDARSDLAQMLATAISWKAPEALAAEAERRAARYDGAGVFADERERAAHRAELAAAQRARFVDGAVLALPIGSRFSYTFNPNDVSTLEGFGSVYGTAKVTDEWGILEVTSGGLLLLRDSRGMLTGLRVPAPADPDARPLSGDGWTLALADGWTLGAGERAADRVVQRAK